MKASAYELYLSIPTHIDATIVCHLVYDAESSLVACYTSILGMCKLRYLQGSSRILEWNFHDSAQNNGSE